MSEQCHIVYYLSFLKQECLVTISFLLVSMFVIITMISKENIFKNISSGKM